jgi:hypothetical protein
MGKTLIGILGLIVGIVIGAFGGLNLGGGAMMGTGVAAGLSAGVCATVQAAQEEGLLSAEQVDQVLGRAAADLSAAASLPPEEKMVGGAADCAAVLETLKAGAAQ